MDDSPYATRSNVLEHAHSPSAAGGAVGRWHVPSDANAGTPVSNAVWRACQRRDNPAERPLSKQRNSSQCAVNNARSSASGAAACTGCFHDAKLLRGPEPRGGAPLSKQRTGSCKEKGLLKSLLRESCAGVQAPYLHD